MNTPVHSAPARASQSHMTRREALASVGALALAASGTAVLAGEPHNSTELDSLIAACLKAESDWLDADRALYELKFECERHLHENPVSVECLGAKPWAIEISDSKAVLDGLVTRHTSDEVARLMLLRGQHRQVADLSAAIVAALSNEATNLGRLHAAQASISAHEEKVGLTAAEAREAAADAATRAALHAVLSYRPKTMAEVHRYFDFLRSETAFGCNYPSEAHVRKIFAALSSPTASVEA